MAHSVSDRLAKSTGNSRRKNARGANTGRMEWSLYDSRGRRKYLVSTERSDFLRAALAVRGETSSFCAVLAFSGARISEVLRLTPEQIDDVNGTINFKTLKRRRVVIRAVPMPRNLFLYLDEMHQYQKARKDVEGATRPLWAFSRTTAWRRVKQVMKRTSVPSYLTTSRAVRHAFGAEASDKRIVLTLIKEWMGHANIKTTEIYTRLVGQQEREQARLTWHEEEIRFSR
jgi:integrase/recombinase XerD